MAIHQAKYKTVIVGAGIAGLTAAYKLYKQGEEFLLIEAKDQVGGNWSSRKYKNSIYEFGPNTLMNRSEAINQIIDELGIEVLSEKFKDSVRYLYLDDNSPSLSSGVGWRLYEIGSNPLALLLSGILSPWGIIRAALEPFIARHPEPKATCHPEGEARRIQKSNTDESVYDFISRRFGKEIAERIIAHALQGIWASDIKKLSSKVALKKLTEFEEKHGSVLRGILSPKAPVILRAKPEGSTATKRPLASISFSGGMQELTQAIAAALPEASLKLGSKLIAITNTNPGYQLELESGEIIHTENLYLASQAFNAAKLLKNISSNLAASLASIYYAPIFLVAYTLPKKLFESKALRGFGYISGKKEHYTLGTIFSSELFAKRNLADEYLLTSFLGGCKNPQILDFSEADLMLQAINEAKEVFLNNGVKLEDKDFSIVDSLLIPQAIPQYELGFLDTRKAIYNELKKLPGLKLLGNYLEGVSIPDTVNVSLNQAACP